MLRQLNLSPEENLSFSEEKGEITKAKSPWDFVPAGHKIGKPVPLFKELVRLFQKFVYCLAIVIHVLTCCECRKMKK